MMIMQLLISLVLAKTVKVAVLDSGYDSSKVKDLVLCEPSRAVEDDTFNHGTPMVSLIKKGAGAQGYCFYIYKVMPGPVALSTKALKDAIRNRVDVINYSGGSINSFNHIEQKLIRKYLNQGGVFIAAAGNENTKLTKSKCNYYPACLDSRIIVIGNKGNTTNYGPVIDHVVNGNDIEIDDYKASGTSISAALFTGLYVRALVMINELQNQ